MPSDYFVIKGAVLATLARLAQRHETYIGSEISGYTVLACCLGSTAVRTQRPGGDFGPLISSSVRNLDFRTCRRILPNRNFQFREPDSPTFVQIPPPLSHISLPCQHAKDIDTQSARGGKPSTGEPSLAL